MSALDRILFISYFREKITDFSLSTIGEIFYHGFKMDLSLAAYMSVLPFLVYSLTVFIPAFKVSGKWLSVYTGILLVFFALTSSINLNLYREWGDKISERAIAAFFISPKEAIASTSSSPVLFSVLLILLIIVFGGFLYYLLTSKKSPAPQGSWKTALIRFVVISVFLFSCIRGGYGRATLNSTVAYFSENAFLNHAAVNTHWAFMKDLIAVDRTVNPYKYFEQPEAEKILAPVFASEADSSESILTTQRPNVVLVILESFTAGLIESLGGETQVTPNFEKLRSQGLLFDRIYAASDRSDKGIVGIYSGFPAQGPESIIKHIIKHENLPGMGQEMTAAGYASSFYYGGQSEFYNFKSYMLAHGNAKVVDQSSFNQSEINSSWGVYDALVFDRLLKDASSEKKPFFKTLFTITNHEPFELETAYKFGEATIVNKFRSTAYYTDSVVYDFIEKAKLEPWYSNTLFVFVADHGHRLPTSKWSLDEPERFHIPLLFFGEVLKPAQRGRVMHRLGNQTDLVATLFHQLDLPTERYPWSRDLLNPTVKEYAFFNSKDGFGVRSNTQDISFNAVGNIVSYKREKNHSEAANKELLDKAKAYYQEVYRKFLSY
ncbi:sulfatase-like hydrolase/transferase [Sphingobacteriaceae bacterium WQ 2009]|uniref:Sulfatase-like hydrolase/transferase n=2 Tax=Rhinopithecimicrobium faecis TaxID=2820698 RepID=A0A8T4H6J7_9SPHI|nr:sulfatase-like hydrolase/transferase [Sphingobacteriaceae bacterium WQ 2009]